MKRLGLALIFSALALSAVHSADSEGRRMLVWAPYGSASTPGSTATTTVIDFSAIACREARDELRRNAGLKALGFRLVATCVEP
jgi:hypothetical protein